VSGEEPPYSDYYLVDVPPDTLPRDWRALVYDDPNDPQALNRRQLEVVALLELAAAIKGRRNVRQRVFKLRSILGPHPD
jgi:hypothetical protein